MIKYRYFWYSGIKVHVVEAKKDAAQNVTMSIMAEPYGPTAAKLISGFSDSSLESQGWKKMAVVNGGLFFTEGGVTYAEGIEKVFGTVNENDDARLDTCLALGEKDGMPYIATQSYIKSILGSCRGAITSAFGLINNGLTDTRGSALHSTIYTKRSGRTIIGKKLDGTIVFATFAGATGYGGLTGVQTVALAKYLGLANAVCMDGGGSACMMYNGQWKVSTSRKVKNAVAIYVK